MKMRKFPKFDSYACVGDYIEWEKDGFDIRATIEFDHDTKPTDFDCYTPIKIKQWKNDEWFFCGIVLSVSKNGVEIEDHAASLWGIDCNYNRTSNRYLSEVCQQLEDEALEAAKERTKQMIEALQ